MNVTIEQVKWLAWLKENGSSAWMDQYGRLIANGEVSFQNAQICFLNLVCKGFIEARNERFIITDAGHAFLELQPTKKKLAKLKEISSSPRVLGAAHEIPETT